VENQIDLAERDADAAPAGSASAADSRSSAQKQSHDRQRELLRLSRANVQRQLENCQNERYRDQLLRALADLDGQLATLEATASGQPR
jgi:hypothetical protein